jgi:hypothetical protein
VQRLRVCVHVRSRVHDMLGSGSLRWVKKALKARKGITCKRPSRSLSQTTSEARSLREHTQK